MEIIKTIQWNAESNGLFALCARICKLGQPINPCPNNFAEFIVSYPSCSRDDLLRFFKRWLMNDRFKDADVTASVTHSENSCLFATHGINAEALDIISRYIRILNNGGEIPASWAYLDQEEKAIVHFVDRNGYYAELYCQTADTASAIHLLDDNGQQLFVPVVFMPQFNDVIIANAKAWGNCHLQDYLPCEKFECLRKGGKKNSGLKDFRNVNSNPRVHDSWDIL